MSCTFGEVPDVTVVEDFFLISPKLINGRDEDGAVVHNAPFGLLNQYLMIEAEVSDSQLYASEVLESLP